MDILQEQSFEINHLVARAGRFKVEEYQKALLDIINKYKEFSVGSGNYMITTTKFMEILNGEQIVEVEFMLPVKCQISVEDPYIFKSKLKLTNALYTKVCDINKLQEAVNTINQYIVDQEMLPITSVYFVQKKEENQTFIEVYVGLNPNII